MTRWSVDKCSGPDCACVIAAGFKKVKVTNLQINGGFGLDRGELYFGPPGGDIPPGLAMKVMRDIQYGRMRS